MSYIDSTDKFMATMQIQRMLRDIELLENEFSRVPISGIYENETREAVREFQSKYGLEVTGVVDFDTWDTLNSIHDKTRFERRGVRKVQLVPSNTDFAIFPNEINDLVFVIQYMLLTISPNHDELENQKFTGVYDAQTVDAIRSFQRKNLLDDNGIIDGATLEALFDEYESALMQRY